MRHLVRVYAIVGIVIVALFLVFVPVIPTHPFACTTQSCPVPTSEFTLWESITFYVFHFGGVYGFCGQYALAYGNQFGVPCT